MRLPEVGQAVSPVKPLKAGRGRPAHTNKLKLVRVGKTTEGRDWYIAVISAPANLSQLDRHKDTARKLAMVKGLTEAQAHELARSGKAIIHIDGGLHATEVAPAQRAIQLAYKLVTAVEGSVSYRIGLATLIR